MPPAARLTTSPGRVRNASGAQVPEDQSGPKSSIRRFEALVLHRAGEAGASENLSLVVEGQHAEADRLAGVEGDARQAIGGSSRYEVEVRGAAADDHAQRHDRVRARFQGGHGYERKLERAGHPHETPGGSRGVERALRAGDQAV